MKNAPECRACKYPTVEVEAGILTSIKYWYCRECKNEVDDRGFVVKVEKKQTSTEELDEYLEEQIAEMEAEGGYSPANPPPEDDEDEGSFYDPLYHQIYY